MATPIKFNTFHKDLAEKKHDFSGDVLKVMLSNTLPVVTNTVKGNITEIAAGNGYVAGGAQASIVSSSQVSGVYKCVVNDVVFTAAGGTIGPFRYAVIYNDTAASKNLIAWWEYPGGSTTLQDGESVTVDFNATNGLFQLG